MHRFTLFVLEFCCAGLLILCMILDAAGASTKETAGGDKKLQPVRLKVVNGWYVYKGRVIWGNAQYNGWWRPGQRPNLARNAPGEIRPNRTEDLDKLTDNMLRWGYPGFEHNYGLWYDRRRDRHDKDRRKNGKVVPPFLELPWQRSGRGKAWDGLSKYDLTRFNPWYFSRLKQFAGLCDKKGTILLYDFYMQHNLLETDAHYVDFPWRPDNCIQKTGMPERNPAANIFYDVSNPVRKKLHRMYMRKCLDELGGYSNVIFLLSEEYTGPAPFMMFWLDTVLKWQQEKQKKVHLCLSGCKDVIDAVLAVPKYRKAISTIDLRYWWYKADGTLFAPKGGRQVAGRYTAVSASDSPSEQVYRQVKEYRMKYPDKAIIKQIEASRQQTWAFLMGGGSLLVRYLEYPGHKDPPKYIAPGDSHIILPAYRFIQRYLSTTLMHMRPLEIVLDKTEYNWCIGWPNHTYLIYAMHGGRFRLDPGHAAGTYKSKWLDPRTGRLISAGTISFKAGKTEEFSAPDGNDWVLWLSRKE